MRCTSSFGRQVLWIQARIWRRPGGTCCTLLDDLRNTRSRGRQTRNRRVRRLQSSGSVLSQYPPLRRSKITVAGRTSWERVRPPSHKLNFCLESAPFQFFLTPWSIVGGKFGSLRLGPLFVVLARPKFNTENARFDWLLEVKSCISSVGRTHDWRPTSRTRISA